METLPSRRRRRAVRPREPYVGGECALCGSARVVTPCPSCLRWFLVCDCDELDRGNSFDRYVGADGRCPRCRGRSHNGGEA